MTMNTDRAETVNVWRAQSERRAMWERRRRTAGRWGGTAALVVLCVVVLAVIGASSTTAVAVGAAIGGASGVERVGRWCGHRLVERRAGQWL